MTIPEMEKILADADAWLDTEDTSFCGWSEQVVPAVDALAEALKLLTGKEYRNADDSD